MNEHCRGCIRYLKSCSGMTKAVCEKHQLRIPRTNADCIRSWSNEELAEFTIGVADGVFKLLTGEKMPDDKREEMKMQWLDWLRQEADT